MSSYMDRETQKKVDKLYEQYRRCTREGPASSGSVVAAQFRSCEIYLREAKEIQYSDINRNRR